MPQERLLGVADTCCLRHGPGTARLMFKTRCSVGVTGRQADLRLIIRWLVFTEEITTRLGCAAKLDQTLLAQGFQPAFYGS